MALESVGLQDAYESYSLLGEHFGSFHLMVMGHVAQWLWSLIIVVYFDIVRFITECSVYLRPAL